MLMLRSDNKGVLLNNSSLNSDEEAHLIHPSYCGIADENNHLEDLFDDISSFSFDDREEDDEFIEVTSSQQKSHHQKKKRTPRPYVKRLNRTVSNVPRVLKNDIRRQYSYMFINLINSADFNLFSSFFNVFCLPNIHCVTTSPSKLPEMNHSVTKTPIEIFDSQQAAQMMFKSIASIPDLTMSLKDTKIYIGKEESFITVGFAVSGTRLYMLPDKANETEKVVDKVNNSSNSVSYDSVHNDTTNTDTSDSAASSCSSTHVTVIENQTQSSHLTTMQNYYEKMMQNPIPPMKIKLIGSVHFYVDNNKKIRKMYTTSEWQH